MSNLLAKFSVRPTCVGFLRHCENELDGGTRVTKSSTGYGAQSTRRKNVTEEVPPTEHRRALGAGPGLCAKAAAVLSATADGDAGQGGPSKIY